MAKKAITEKNLTIPQVKKLLVSLGEENLDQFQRRTLDYASKFSKVDAKASEKLIKELVEKFGLEEEETIQVVNCMPKSVEELKVFLSAGRRIIETSKLEAIVNLLDEHRKAK